MSSFDKALIRIGILAVICLSPIGHGVGIIAMISVIGIPIALLIGVIPAVFLILLAVRLVRLVLPVPGRAGWALSAIIGIGLLSVPAYLANQRLDGLAESLVVGDKTELARRYSTGTIALVQETGDQDCNDFCQRALLNGVVNAVTVAARKDPNADPDALTGLRYRFERRDQCPTIDLKDSIGALEVPGEQRPHGRPRVSDLIRLKMAGGACMIAEPASVAGSDAVITLGSIKRGRSDFGAGLDVFADTVRASRVSFAVRNDGRLSEVYRRTAVNYHRLLPVLTLSWIMGYQFDATPGFLRRIAYRGDAGKYRTDARLEPLIAALGYDLALRDDTAREDVRRIITAALDDPRPVDRATAKVMQDFYESIWNDPYASPKDGELALRILQNETVPVPRDASAPVRKFAANDPDFAARYASVAFTRLVTAGTEEEDHPTYLGYPLAYLASAIEALPNESVLPYRADLERLARDPDRRVLAYRALRKLSVFRADAVPTLLWLIDEADRLAGERFGREQRALREQKAWQHPYIAGIGGLCAMGHAGASAIAPLLERLSNGTVAKFGSYRRQMIHTLISLGAAPDSIWPHLQTDDKNFTREHFDREVRRARRNIECLF